MADIDDIYVPPNAAAYEKEEIRHGPPLSYVGEKLRGTLYHLHGLCQVIREAVPDNLPVPASVQAEPYSTKQDGLVGPADAAFYRAPVAFLALYNSLGRLGEWEKQQEKIEALKNLQRHEFEEWLDSIEEGGSVT